jgi:tripartite-type tricarboxylate transporter receptor subunit TctC
MNFVRRSGKILGVMVFIMCLTVGYHQAALAAATQPKVWKPEGRVTIIVNVYGGAYDLLARQISSLFPEYLGQSAIVTAVTGAGGGNALDTLYKSKPDGRTFAITGIGTHIQLSLEKLYPWSIDDLGTVLAMDAPPYGVYTSPKSGYKTYEDLAKMKKVVRIATGQANFALLPLILDFEKKGVQYKVARFKGSADASLAVIAGNADLTIGALSGVHTDKIRSGDFRALLVFDTKRFPFIPDVSCLSDLGMPKEWAYYRIIRLFQVAPGTPENVQKGLRDGITQILKDKRTLEWSQKADTPVDLLPEEAVGEAMGVVIGSFKDKKNERIVKEYF